MINDPQATIYQMKKRYFNGIEGQKILKLLHLRTTNVATTTSLFQWLILSDYTEFLLISNL